MYRTIRPFPRLATLLLASVLLSGPGACRRSGPPAGAMKKKPGERVGAVVFVGKKDACDCTQKRVSTGWKALQSALGAHPGIKVERIAMDVDKDRVRTLRKERRFMTLPALYVFNPDGKLVAMLEGELSSEAIATALK